MDNELLHWSQESLSDRVPKRLIEAYTNVSDRFRNQVQKMKDRRHRNDKKGPPVTYPRISPAQWARLLNEGRSILKLLDVIAKGYDPNHFTTKGSGKAFINKVITEVKTRKEILPTFEVVVEKEHVRFSPHDGTGLGVIPSEPSKEWNPATVNTARNQVVEFQKAYEYYTQRIVGRVNGIDDEIKVDQTAVTQTTAVVSDVLRVTKYLLEHWLRLAQQAHILE